MASIKRRSFIGGLFASTIAFFIPFSRQEKMVAKEIVKKDYQPTRREQNKLASILKGNRYSLSNVAKIARENRMLQQFNLSLDQIRHLTSEERNILVNEKDWNNILEPMLHKIMNRLVPNRPKRPTEDNRLTSWVKFYIPKKDEDA